MRQDLTQEQLGAVFLWIVKELVRIVLFDDLATVHEDHPVCHCLGKPHLMRYAEHGHPVLGQLNHDLQHLFDHLRIQCGGGFIKQHDLGVHTQTAGNRHPLLLSTRQLSRVLTGLLRDLDPVEIVHRNLFRLDPGHLSHPDWTQGEIVEHREVGEQVEVLEHHPRLRAGSVRCF